MNLKKNIVHIMAVWSVFLLSIAYVAGIYSRKLFVISTQNIVITSPNTSSKILFQVRLQARAEAEARARQKAAMQAEIQIDKQTKAQAEASMAQQAATVETVKGKTQTPQQTPATKIPKTKIQATPYTTQIQQRATPPQSIPMIDTTTKAS